MLSEHIKTWIVGGALAICISTSASAQTIFQEVGGHHRGDPTAGDSFDNTLFSPIMESNDFDFFNHYDCGSYQDIPANTGAFFTYDRMYMNILRPDRNIRPHVGDWTWGNRFDTGFRTQSGVGALGSIFKLNDPDPGNNFDNSVAIAGGEAMATFAFTPRRSLVQFEPMIGIRFMQFVEHGVDLNGFSVTDDVTNNMFGPQGGFRLSYQQGRLLLSTEGRFFSAWNYQEYFRVDDSDWAPVGELRAEMTYEVFKQAALRFGYSGTMIGEGLGRNALRPDHKEDAWIQGLTMGFVINR
jgi:hypothetical protein